MPRQKPRCIRLVARCLSRGKFCFSEWTTLPNPAYPAMKFIMPVLRALFLFTVCGVATASEIRLTAHPASLSFNAPEAVVTTTETLTVGPTDWGGVVSAKIAYLSGEPGWLNLIATAPRSYLLKVSAANLSAGRYSATITFSSSAPAQSVDVPVTLTIGLGILLPSSQ
jgi:hypothetical protein